MAQPTAGLVASPVRRVAAAALHRLDPESDIPRDDGPASRADQAELLARIVERGGPAALLTAGGHIEEVAPDPVVMVLLNSNSVDVLLDKISRLNRFLHSHHRQQVLTREPGSVAIEHVSLRGGAPSPYESLFVAGLNAGLITAIGGIDVSVAFPRSPHSRVVMRNGAVVGEVPEVGTAVWDVRWGSFAARRPIPGLDELLASRLGPDLEVPPTTRSVRAIVTADPARRWTVAAAASELAMSPRTLQRRLNEESTTFQEEVVSTRIDEAQRMLDGEPASITEIAYRCGFADSAHFSRSFKSVLGATPSDWRDRRRKGLGETDSVVGR